MKNTSSLLLTLVSYLIMLTTILFLLFAAMPPSLKAQTNAETFTTNATVTNTAATVGVEKPLAAQALSGQVNLPGIHWGKAGSQVNEGEGFTRALALMIPIVAIVMGCSIPMVIVGLLLYFRHHKNKMLHETVRAMVDKGVPIPPEMFKKETACMESGRAGRSRNDFRKGLILIGVGIGVVMLAGKAGFIILFLGAAFLVASFFEKNSDNPPPKA